MLNKKGNCGIPVIPAERISAFGQPAPFDPETLPCRTISLRIRASDTNVQIQYHRNAPVAELIVPAITTQTKEKSPLAAR